MYKVFISFTLSNNPLETLKVKSHKARDVLSQVTTRVVVKAEAIVDHVAWLREGGFHPLREIGPAQRKALRDHSTKETKRYEESIPREPLTSRLRAAGSKGCAASLGLIACGRRYRQSLDHL